MYCKWSITRKAYCAGNPGTSFDQKDRCNQKTKDECLAAKKLCHFVKETEVKDTGAPGKTPAEKKWSKGIDIKEGSFGKFFENGKMKGNLTVAGCKKAGDRMADAGMSGQKAARKLNFALNIAPAGLYSQSERKSCLKGLHESALKFKS